MSRNGRTLPDAKSGLRQGRRCNAGREGTPVLTVVQEGSWGEEEGRAGSLIDEIVREGARRMLAEALQAEVDAYIAAHAAERDGEGRGLVVRNGYHQPRELLTSAGAVEVTAPRVNDKRTGPGTGERKRFSSAILPSWARKTPKITEVLPLLHLHGLPPVTSCPCRPVPRLVSRAVRGREHPADRAVAGWAARLRAAGPACCATAPAGACAGRCWRPGTARWGSGAACGRCSPRPGRPAALGKGCKQGRQLTNR